MDIAERNRKLVEKISDSVRFGRFLFPYMQNKFDFSVQSMSLFRFNMSFFCKKRLKSFLRLKRKKWLRPRRQPRPRLPYGPAIWLCHMALPYGIDQIVKKNMKSCQNELQENIFSLLRSSPGSVFDFKSI